MSSQKLNALGNVIKSTDTLMTFKKWSGTTTWSPWIDGSTFRIKFPSSSKCEPFSNAGMKLKLMCHFSIQRHDFDFTTFTTCKMFPLATFPTRMDKSFIHYNMSFRHTHMILVSFFFFIQLVIVNWTILLNI